MRVLMVLNKSYSADPRAQRAVSALSRAGHAVIVLSFADRACSPPELPNVVFRECPIRRRRSSRFRYLLEYGMYLTWSIYVSITTLVRLRYDILQVFLLPEPLVLVALIPRLCGVRIVSDWMDLGYELYETKYPRRRGDALHALIRISERLVIAISHVTIFPNKMFINALTSRGIIPPKSCIILNAADPEVFQPVAHNPKEKACRLLFSGTISRRNGVPVLLEAFAQVRVARPDCTLTILGEQVDSEIGRVCASTDPHLGVQYVGRIPVAAVPKYLSSADIGIIPTSATPFTRCNVPTRIFEFGTVGLPVICADLPGIRQYFGDHHVLFHVPDDAANLAQRMLQLLDDPDLRKVLADGLRQRCGELSWDRSRTEYLRLISAIGNRPGSGRCAKNRLKRRRTSRRPHSDRQANLRHPSDSGWHSGDEF